MSEENKVDNPLPPVADPLLEKAKNLFLDEYEPVSKFGKNVKLMSTQEIYNLIFSIYPDPIAFSVAEIASWMHAQGFHFLHTAELRYDWMLASKN